MNGAKIELFTSKIPTLNAVSWVKESALWAHWEQEWETVIGIPWGVGTLTILCEFFAAELSTLQDSLRSLCVILRRVRGVGQGERL